MARSYLDYLVRTHPDKYACCKTPDCPGIRQRVENELQFTCTTCLKQYCVPCDCIYHEDMTCEEFLKFRRANEQTEEADRLYIDSLIESRAAIRCPAPHCGCLLCKLDGCNYVVCASCKSPVCWETGMLRSQCGGGHNCH